MKKNLVNIILVISVILSTAIAGCIQNQGDLDQESDNLKEPNENITIQHFVGDWHGFQIQNQIELNLTFFNNFTGIFQDIDITWEFNETLITLGMFEGETPSYYTYTFEDNNQSMILQNLYVNETFNLSKR